MVYEDIANELLAWWKTNKRDFPWRYSTDPYKILIAEKLLQQTAVGKRVVVAYIRIIENFPTIYDLANAKEEMVAVLFFELGLSYRAKELIAISKYIIKEFEGVIPQDRELLLHVPGIGEYIARAILSFGYNLPYAVVDTNIARFLFRFFELSNKRSHNPARSRPLIEIAQTLLPLGQSKEFNFALLDLCAKVCLVRTPLCGICPIRFKCATGFSSNSQGAKIGSGFTTQK